ncbi:hypothetical protein KDA_18110 [Dictyobacter alpinus]|uniref:Uncharacterized protein n=1 Tax=Dictyobacter alpinus TaxID=2014873 RepID=A0A402B4T0_9CHLR|nr:hypothetical protein [Dictyobacter alpinus]GCE26327.1 hypothetical protein KDA_18110 [Dictyobacter alpinus]
MLIPGGLIAVAVLALVGAFFLSRGGNNTKPARVTSASAKPEPEPEPETPAQPAQPAIDKTKTIPAPEARRQDQQQEFPQNPNMPDISREHTTAMPEFNGNHSMQVSQPANYWQQEQAAQQPTQDVAALNRRLYELAGQLHILQRQQRDIEQGLVQLSGIIEHLQSPTNPTHNNSSIPSMPYSE